MSEIRAIETLYRGRRFRSRLEARWAVFFDALGTEWDYEREGFELPSGRYLPDFWLPKVQAGCWFEVKGQEPTEREQVLARELADRSGSPVYIFAGSIKAEIIVYENGMLSGVTALWEHRLKNSVAKKESRGLDEWVLQHPKGLGFFPGTRMYDEQNFSICADCGLIGIVGGGSACYLPCQDSGHRLCRHCHRTRDRHHHRIDGNDDIDYECCDGEEHFEPPCGCSFVPSTRVFLRGLSAPTSFQKEILTRHCDCGGLQLRDQQQRLKAAFDKATSARFEHGENVS